MYLLGSLERGLTVYKQQVRAHNLTWALWELETAKDKEFKVAVVGGGICGLTAAVCCLSLFEQARVTVFEKCWDLCPFQQGSDSRWLHPRIYEWPVKGSRSPGANLPLLTWSEGRASDVARKLLFEFGKYCDEFDEDKKRLTTYVGLEDLKVTAAGRQVDWIGSEAKRHGAFFSVGDSIRGSENFDLILAAPGFGFETIPPAYPSLSYWRNEQIGQPILDGGVQRFLISGYRDGALIDLFRLTIERFRQDTILYEIFEPRLEDLEDYFQKAWPEEKSRENAFDFFTSAMHKWLTDAKFRLSTRLRKDTRVVLHIRGRGNITAFREIFGPDSSFLNRLLAFLLYHCNAFEVSFDELKAAVAHHGIPKENVLCRYGIRPLEHLAGIFTDFEQISARLESLKREQPQTARLASEPGRFRNYRDRR